MASLTHLRDLTENFFQCSVCLGQLKEPKLLPCLHRYCTDCLKAVMEQSNTGTIDCPMCEQQCPIPGNGVEGFKTDFHMKNVLEFIQLQNSYENKHLKKCVSCSKEIQVFAYCFKCRDFLCEQCYNVHISSKMFSDHQRHILRLDNIATKKLTLEKLSTLTEDPRCHDHVNKEAHLCCVTCGNIPVCIACTYNEHKGHDLHDVTEQAETERNQLRLKLSEVNQHKSKLYELPKKTESSKQQLLDNVSKKTEILNNQHKKQVERLKAKIEENKIVRKVGFADIQNKRTEEEKQIDLNYEEEFKELNKKYDDIRKTCTTKYDNELKQFKENCDDIDGEFFRKLGSLDRNFKSLTTAKDLLKWQNMNNLQEISDYCDQIIRRYENFAITASSILDCKDDWTDVQCIPDVKTSCESLIDEMKREFPELESLSDIVIDDIPEVIVDISMSEHEESVVDVEGIIAKGWSINGITSSTDGDIVITGVAAANLSHITVINKKGEIQRQDQVKRGKQCLVSPYRYCCYLAESKLVTACAPDEIGLYDVRDGSYKEKYVSEIFIRWPDDQYITCVTTNVVTKHIIVGTNSRCVYVFDDQMNFSDTITLSDVIKASRDITVHMCNLLICDYSSSSAFVFKVDGSEGKLLYEFTKPGPDVIDWRPYSVCRDKQDFVYMLWGDGYDRGRRTLVQYSPDGGQLLATKVAFGAECVTGVEENGLEYLSIATLDYGRLHTYRPKEILPSPSQLTSIKQECWRMSSLSDVRPKHLSIEPNKQSDKTSLGVEMLIGRDGGVLCIANTNVSLEIPPDAVETECLIQMKIITDPHHDESVLSFASNSSIVVELLPRKLRLHKAAKLTLPHCLVLKDGCEWSATALSSHHEEGKPPQWKRNPDTQCILRKNECTLYLNGFSWETFEVGSEIVEGKNMVLYAASRLNQVQVPVCEMLIDVGYYLDLPTLKEKVLEMNDVKLLMTKPFIFFNSGELPLQILFEETNPMVWTCLPKYQKQTISFRKVATKETDFCTHQLHVENPRTTRRCICYFKVWQMEDSEDSEILAFAIENCQTTLSESGSMESAVGEPNLRTHKKNDQCCVQYKILEILSEKMCKECPDLGRNLGLSDAEINRNSTDTRGGVKEKVYQMLLKWKQKNGSNATYKVLGEALLNSGRMDLQEILIGLI